jgi:hypothetical protein
VHSKVSDWLPSYIKAMRPFLEIFKIAGYFPGSPRTGIRRHHKNSVATAIWRPGFVTRGLRYCLIFVPPLWQALC